MNRSDNYSSLRNLKIVFPTIQEIPPFEFKESVSIGKSQGDIQIDDISLSPLHATFYVKNNVLSVLDHQSQNGVLINGKPITPGKEIILSVADEIYLGNLRLKILFEEVEEIPLVHQELQNSDKTFKIDLSQIKEGQGLNTTNPPQIVDKAKSNKNKKTNKRKRSRICWDTDRGANTILRVWALMLDVLLSYTVFNLLDESLSLTSNIASLKVLLLEEGTLYYEKFLAPQLINFQEVLVVVKDGFVYLEDEFRFSFFLIIFLIWRLMTVLILGVSFGQLILGVTYRGNFIWARIGGLVREVLSTILTPFLIFDVPALFSRPTLKEYLSGTRLTCPNSLISFFLTLLVTPLIVSVFLLHVFFLSGEPLKNMTYSEGQIQTDHSMARFTKVCLDQDSCVGLDENKVSLFPHFATASKEHTGKYFILTLGETSSWGELVFEQKMEINDLLKDLFPYQPLLAQSYQQLYSTYLNLKIENSFIKSQNNQASAEKELMELIKLAFELDLDHWLNDPMKYGIYSETLISFRQKLIAQLGEASAYSFQTLLENKEYFVLLSNSSHQKVVRLSLSKQFPIYFKWKDGNINESDFFQYLKFNELQEIEKPSWDKLLQEEDLVSQYNSFKTIYFEWAKRAEIRENNAAQEVLAASLDSYIQFLQKRIDQKTLELDLIELKEILVALKNKEWNYFEKGLNNESL